VFGNLTKPAWQHPSAERRLKAISKLNSSNEKERDILCQLALSDPDQQVAQASLNALNDPLHLLKTLLSLNDEPQQNHWHARLAKVLNSDQFDSAALLALVAQRTEITPYLIQHSSVQKIRQRLIEQQSHSNLAQLIGEVDFVDTRKQIAEILVEESDLEVARRNLKGKDKTAERLIKQKLNQIRTAAKAQGEANDSAQELCEKLEHIGRQNQWRSEYGAQFNVFTQRWEAIDPKPSSDLEQQFEHARQIVEQRIAAQEQTLAEQRAATQYLEQQNALLNKIRPLTMAELTATIATTKQAMQELDAQADDLPGLSEEQTAVKVDQHAAIQAMLDLTVFIHDLDHEPDVDDIGYAIALLKPHRSLKSAAIQPELKTLKTGLVKQAQQTQQEYQRSLKALHQRISRLSATSRKGNLNVARKELAATQNLASHYRGKDRDALDDRLNKAEQAVNKLSDWHDFATEPKFIQLCEKMEQLVEAKIHPENRAQKIRNLQNQWKALGINHDESLWERFKNAADNAFEPCAEFFAERDQERAANLAKRQPFISELEQLLKQTNWDDDPNYAKIEQQLKEIHQRWQTIKNVERKAGEQQWKTYKNLRQLVFDRLTPEYERNLKAKQNLIEQAARLAGEDINQSSFEKLKNLQQRWKEIGITRIKDDRQTWTNFKKNTDAAYRAIREFEQSESDKFDDMLNEHQRIVDEINTLSKSKEAADLQVEQLEQDFKQLPALPKIFPERKLELINKSFSKALNQYQRTRDKAQQATSKQQQQRVLQKAQLCGELEAAWQQAEPNQTAIDELIEQLNAIELDDASISKLYAHRIKQASQKNRATFDEQRIELCIRMEIAANIDSPKQDRAKRTEIQLADLKQHGLGNPSQSLSDLKLDWLTTPGASSDLQAKLEQRVSKHQDKRMKHR